MVSDSDILIGYMALVVIRRMYNIVFLKQGLKSSAFGRLLLIEESLCFFIKRVTAFLQ